MLGECVISSVLSHHSKNLKRQMDQCYSSFIWQAKENTSLMHEGGQPKRCEEREAPGSALAPPFICFFLLSLSLLSVNWSSQEGCLFHLRSLLQSSGLPLFYFHRLSPSLSFSHCHSGLLFSYSNYSHLF